MFYKVLIKPHYSYCSTLVYESKSKILNILQILQNNNLKIYVLFQSNHFRYDGLACKTHLCGENFI